jgi:hypothetical protein
VTRPRAGDATALPPLPEPLLGTALLVGYGALPWTTLSAGLAGIPAAWADYGGFHLAAAPDEPPPYTHLWAWTPDWLLRARIDGATAITGALLLTPGSSPLGRAPVDTWPVTYQRLTSRTWTRADSRVSALPDAIADQPFDLYQIPGERPVTFIARPDPTPPEPDKPGGRRP